MIFPLMIRNGSFSKAKVFLSETKEMNHDTQMPPTVSCSNCHYFRPAEQGFGSCHRYPPSYAGDASPKESHHWRFPVVSAGNWCGEFVAADAVPAGGSFYAVSPAPTFFALTLWRSL